MHQRIGCNGGLRFAIGAFVDVPGFDQTVPHLSALGANKSPRPANGKQMVATRLLVRKQRHKLTNGRHFFLLAPVGMGVLFFILTNICSCFKMFF